MMSKVVEHLGRRPKVDPTLPQVPPRPAVPHANAAQALAFVHGMDEELKALREEVQRLRADLNLAMMRNRDLESERGIMRADMEAYRRYSVEVKTHLQHIVDAATRANEAALEAGEKPIVDPVTQKQGDMMVEEIGRKFGADTRPPPVTNE